MEIISIQTHALMFSMRSFSVCFLCIIGGDLHYYWLAAVSNLWMHGRLCVGKMWGGRKLHSVGIWLFLMSVSKWDQEGFSGWQQSHAVTFCSQLWQLIWLQHSLLLSTFSNFVFLTLLSEKWAVQHPCPLAVWSWWKGDSGSSYSPWVSIIQMQKLVDSDPFMC